MPSLNLPTFRTTILPLPLQQNANGKAVSNLLLQSIVGSESTAVIPALEFVRLSPHQTLHDSGAVIKSVYFLNDGLASMLAVQRDGKNVEVAVIGKEGCIGVPVVFGFKTSSVRIVTHCESTAYRIEAAKLAALLPQCPGFGLTLQQYGMILGLQSTQLAACNRLHEIDQRLARWLLMSRDRIGNMAVPLTQDFLAQMLGTRRSTVSMAASLLQKAGVITYTRGNVTILNRDKLEEATCECYAAIQQQARTWKTETA
jgi:CRP-like cAMP-binding protein